MKEPGSGVGQSVMRELPDKTRTSVLKRHCMRKPGTDGNLNIMNINKFHIIWLTPGGGFSLYLVYADVPLDPPENGLKPEHC